MNNPIHAIHSTNPALCTWHVFHINNKPTDHCIHCGEPVDNHNMAGMIRERLRADLASYKAAHDICVDNIGNLQIAIKVLKEDGSNSCLQIAAYLKTELQKQQTLSIGYGTQERDTRNSIKTGQDQYGRRLW